MSELTQEDLQYKYEWSVSKNDNPRLIHEDAKHLSRNEGYEMLLFLNKLGMASDKTEFQYGEGSDLTKEARLQIEAMLKKHFKSTAPGRGTVLKWINENWEKYRGNFKAFDKKK